MSQHEHSIQHNIKNDRNLDARVGTSITKEARAALKTLADREYHGNEAACVRACIMAALRQRYLLAE